MEELGHAALLKDLHLQWGVHQVVFLIGAPGCGRATLAHEAFDFDLETDGLDLGRRCPALPERGNVLVRSLDRALIFGSRNGLKYLVKTLSEFPFLKLLVTLEHRHVPVLQHLLSRPVALCKMPERDYYKEHLFQALGDSALEQIAASDELIKEYSHEALEVCLAEQRTKKLFKKSILDAREFAREVGQSYTNRRGLRSWLRALLKTNEKSAFRVFEAVLRVEELPAAYRRDVLDTVFHYAEPVGLVEYYKWDLLSPNRELLKGFVSASNSISWLGFEEAQGAMWVHLLKLIESHLSVFEGKDKIALSEVLEEAHRAPMLPSGCGLELAGFLLTQTTGSLRPETTLVLGRMLEPGNTPNSVRKVIEEAMRSRGHKNHGLFPSNVFYPILAAPIVDEEPKIDVSEKKAPKAEKKREPEDELVWTSAVLKGEAEPDLERLRGLLNPWQDSLHSNTLSGHAVAIQIKDLWGVCYQSWVLKFAETALGQSWDSVRRDSLFELGGDRQVALVLPKLFGEEFFDETVRHHRALLPLALSHPIHEVRRSAAKGVAEYLHPSESIFWRCIVAFIVSDLARDFVASESEDRCDFLAAMHLRKIFWNMQPNINPDYQGDGHTYRHETLQCLDLALSNSGVTARKLLKLGDELEGIATETEVEPEPEPEPEPEYCFEPIRFTTASTILGSLKQYLGQDDRTSSYLWGSFLDFVRCMGVLGLTENFHDWDDLADLLHFGIDKAPRGVDYRESVGLAEKLASRISALPFSVMTICHQLEKQNRERPYLEVEQLQKILNIGLGLPPFFLRYLEAHLAQQIPFKPQAWKHQGAPNGSVIWILELLVDAGSAKAGWILDDYVTEHV